MYSPFKTEFSGSLTSKPILFWIFFICNLSLCIPSDLTELESGQNATHQISVRETRSTCIKPKFTCASLDCIEESKLCNGVKDCKDGLDETANVCKQVKCPNNSFKCDYGGCIEASLKCNGHQDCVDNSDESNTSCPAHSSTPQDLILFWKCKKDEWRCRPSGKCIPNEKKCNGQRDCEDGSDEAAQTCQLARTESRSPKLHSEQNTTKPSSKSKNSICGLPNGTDVTITLTDDEDNWLNTSLLSKAPKFSKIQIFCNADYATPDGEKLQRSVCLQTEEWNPPLSPCLKTCPNLRSDNTVLSCHRGGVDIDCEGELINGTIIRPRCRPLYHSENEVYRDLLCTENGQWDGILPECVPDCGITNTLQQTQSLIFDGKPANASDSPWHVAIYRFTGGTNKSPVLICGGTLISANIVVSAAHCFFDLGRGLTLNSVTEYEIVVSKYSRNYTIVDNGFQKRYKIRDIVFTDAGYNPSLTGQYSNDIVALVLKRKVQMNKFVLPACVDWPSSGAGESLPAEGTPGKLVGWGVDKDKDAGSPTLLYADLPYISYQKCVGKLKQIDTDKFCAGNKTGAGARKGDSGGGLMFRNANTGRYYLRGIVSTTDKDGRTSVAAFTDVSKYVDWLDKVRTKVMKELQSAAADPAGVCNITYNPGQKVELFDEKDNWLNIPLGMKAPKLSTIEITCNPGYTMGNGIRFQRSTCFLKEKWNPPLKTCLKTCPNLHPINMELSCYLGEKRIDCNGELVYGTKIRPSCLTFYHKEGETWYRELKCRENGEWDHNLFECVPDCGISPFSTPVNMSDSPWNVAIYKREDASAPSTLQCSGTLISPTMIVSAANCFYDHDRGEALNSPRGYEIVVSKFTKDYSTIDNAFQKKYEVRDVVFTNQFPPYDPHSLGHSSNNIVVLVTKNPVQMNKFVLPACIDWNRAYFSTPGSWNGKLVGWLWGTNSKLPNSLQHKDFYNSGDYNSPVAGDLDKISMRSQAIAYPKTYSGEGLVSRELVSNRYFLRGISGRATVHNDFPNDMTPFTDISQHVEWLKGIYDLTREDETTSKGCRIPEVEKYDTSEKAFADTIESMFPFSDNDTDFISLLNNATTNFSSLPNKHIVLSDDNDNLLNVSSSSIAPKFSKIQITCPADYTLPDGQRTQRSVCAQIDEWNPPLRPCLKMCPSLSAEHMKLSCYRDNVEVDCNGKMIYGTRVRPRCESYFKREGPGVIYSEMSCQANGYWDHELHQCMPDCGIPKSKPAQLPNSTTTWLPASVGHSPWNVAVYKKNSTNEFMFLCSGTLISANMIVSVAHWFYDLKKRKPMDSTTDYAVVVGKSTLDYNTVDNGYQKSYKIRELVFTDNGYNPTSSRLNDIVVLVLNTPIKTDSFAIPACVDWKSKTNGFQPVEGTPGNLVGWLKGVNTSALHRTQLPFISFRQCVRKLKYIDPDRFCAGSDEGHTVPLGIGGAGLMLSDSNNERYFLRGVWSGRSSNDSVNIGTFTDISKHLDWLERVRDRVAKESTIMEQQTSYLVVVDQNEEILDIK